MTYTAQAVPLYKNNPLERAEAERIYRAVASALFFRRKLRSVSIIVNQWQFVLQ